MRRAVAAVISVVFLLTCLSVPPASAENVQVTAGVGDTTIRISGWTAPFAFVTLMENSVVVGTTTAGADGRYVLLLVGQMPGIHNFRIFSRDSSGRLTEAVTTQLSAAEHNETAVSVFLPPAVTTTEQDNSVILDGSTAPNATVVITVEGKYFTTLADNYGNWRYVIAASDLPASEYHIIVAAILPGGLQSHAAAIPATVFSARTGVPASGLQPGPFWLGVSMAPAAGKTPAGSMEGERHSPPGAGGQLPVGLRTVERSANRAGYPSSLLGFLSVLLLISLGWLYLVHRRHEKNKQKR